MLSVVGSNSQYAKQAEMLNQLLTTKASGKVSFIRVQNVGNVMLEAPNKLSEAIILFCQGLGMMPAVLGTESFPEYPCLKLMFPTLADCLSPNKYSTITFISLIHYIA